MTVLEKVPRKLAGLAGEPLEKPFGLSPSMLEQRTQPPESLAGPVTQKDDGPTRRAQVVRIDAAR